jgi:hypothetical protein
VRTKRGCSELVGGGWAGESSNPGRLTRKTGWKKDQSEKYGNVPPREENATITMPMEAQMCRCEEIPIGKRTGVEDMKKSCREKKS